MGLSPAWQALLPSPDVPKVALVTVSLAGADPTPMADMHMAERSGSMRFASQARVSLPSRIGALPFDPYLLTFPVVEQGRFEPQDRRAEIAEASVAISSEAGVVDALMAHGYGAGATARIDLYCPGVGGSDELLPLIAGPISEQPRFDRRRGAVELSIVDGFPDRDVPFPPGAASRSEFSEMPADLDGVGKRQVIFGAYDDAVECPQIAPDACYLQEPPGKVPPTRFFADGKLMADNLPRIEQRTMAISGQAYDALVFPKPLSELGTLGFAPGISAAGGVGQVEMNPILALLEVVGGFRVAPEARQLALVSPFAFKLLLNDDVESDVLRIVRDRLAPQTDLVFCFRHGAVHFYRLDADTPEVRIGIGTGLLWRIADRDALTELNSVFSSIEVQCGRSAFDDSSLLTILRNERTGTAEIRSLLSRAARRGNLAVPAFDLAVDEDAAGNRSCPSGERLADAYARAHALRGRRHRYKAEWLEGMATDIGFRALLTDPTEELADTPARVVGRRITGAGPELRFITTADPVRTHVPAPRRHFGPFT